VDRSSGGRCASICGDRRSCSSAGLVSERLIEKSLARQPFMQPERHRCDTKGKPVPRTAEIDRVLVRDIGCVQMELFSPFNRAVVNEL